MGAEIKFQDTGAKVVRLASPWPPLPKSGQVEIAGKIYDLISVSRDRLTLTCKERSPAPPCYGPTHGGA